VRRSFALLALVVLALNAAAEAAEPGLEVHLQPRRFGVDDAVQLTVRISEPPAELGAPDLGELVNLEVVAGPSTGSEFSFVNGVASRAQTFTYMLRAGAPGPASVGPVTVVAGEVELSAEPVSAEVVEGSVAPPARRGRRSPLTTDPFADILPRRAPPRVELALRHQLSADAVALGEPLVAVVYLDSTVSSLYDFDWRTAPSYPGFWAQRLDSPEQVTPAVVEVEGTRFYRYEVLRSVLVPLKAGRLEVPEVTAAIGVRGWSFFDRGQLVERSAPTRTVEVAERGPAPPGFTGAVGDLRYRAAVEPGRIESGESAVVTVTLEGRGNLPLVEAPEQFPMCADCDAYPPEESSSVTIDATGIHGARSWQVTLVPRSWGELELEPVTLSVYDPTARRYRSQTLGPLSLAVAPPPATPTPALTPTPIEGAGDRTGGAAGDAAAEAGPSWLLMAVALLIGVGAGGGVTWLATRRSRLALPPRRADQSPAERARELQLILERWWLDVRSTERGRALEPAMGELRSDLEAVRFAPGRADHSETVVELESRLRRLMRQAR
jgi:hypothetical protein